MRALYDVPAPAKLNLFLHVTGRRDDGYHLLQSAFMLIDWCDTLHFERRDDGLLTREDLGPPLPADDLCLRAARALQAASGTSLGAHIGVLKSIPAQAGLGGGSSDAATCLLALNRLWGLGLGHRVLAQIALSLGADVPFFLLGEHAWVEGIGERLQAIALPPARFVVVKPEVGIETSRIFHDQRLTRDTKPAILRDFTAEPFDFGRNDLQPVAERICPALQGALGHLCSLGLKPRMTGSGSAVFAHLGHTAPAPEGLNAWPDGQARLCSNLPAHPLRGWADKDN